MANLSLFNSGLPEQSRGARSQLATALGDGETYYGNHFCDASQVQPMKALWQSPGKVLPDYSTVFRILPGRNPATGDLELDSWRFSKVKNNMGSWINAFTGWRNAGNPAVTFIQHDPANGRCEFRDLPGGLLYNEIFNVVEGKVQRKDRSIPVHWTLMVKGGQNRSPVIAKPKMMFLVLAAVYRRGGTNYDPPLGLGFGNRPVLFDLSADGGYSLIELMNLRADAQGVDPYDFDRLYRIGNPVAVADAPLFSIIMRDTSAPWQRAEAHNLLMTSRDLNRKSAGGYDIDVYSRLEGIDQSLEDHEESLNALPSIRETLVFHPPLVQAAGIAQVMRLRGESPDDRGELALDVLEYAWRDRPDFMQAIPQELWDEYHGKVTVGVPFEEDPEPAAVPAPARRQVAHAPQPAPARPHVAPQADPAPQAPVVGNGEGDRAASPRSAILDKLRRKNNNA